MHVLDRFSHVCGDEVGAVPLNMTTVAEKLSFEGGYMSHFVGKWDAGARYWEMLPTQRGYHSFLGILSKGSFAYSHIERSAKEDKTPELIDFWENNGPAYSFANSSVHQEIHFRDRLIQIVNGHDTSRPLYLHYASRHPHAPLQALSPYVKMYKNVSSVARGVYMAMVTMVDDIIGNVTQKLRDRGMWEDTLMIFASDNGGIVSKDWVCSPYHTSEYDRVNMESMYGTTCMAESGANNWPLRG
eukprot:6072318-Pleurochrysis_carterae.AAC.1